MSCKQLIDEVSYSPVEHSIQDVTFCYEHHHVRYEDLDGEDEEMGTLRVARNEKN